MSAPPPHSAFGRSPPSLPLQIFLRRITLFFMKRFLAGFLILLSAATAREVRDLTNSEGKTIHAEILDLTKKGTLKVLVKGMAFEVPVANLSAPDQAWIAEWDLKRRLGEEGAYYRKEIFADDFSGDAFGERWGHYKSGSVIRDGVLVGITPEGSDHSAVDNIRLEPEQDLELSVKFRFLSDKARSFNVWFDDKDYKGSHAGHICSVSVAPANVTMADAKTGAFENGMYERRNSGAPLSDADKALLAAKSKNVPVKLDLQTWHTLLIRTRGDQVKVSIDGTAVGDFQSEGIAHEAKTLVSLTTNPVDVEYDNFALKAGTAPAQ